MENNLESAETLAMDKVSQDEILDTPPSALQKAHNPDYSKPDEAGWTIPGWDEQYLKKVESSEPPVAPKPPDTLAPEVMVGRVILGQYKLEKLLGEGGMGSVYLAQQTTMDRPAAIKFLLPELGSNQEMVQRFYREAKSASGLRHPCIVQNYNFGCTDDNLMYLAMEYVDGLTLLKYLRIHKTMPWGDLCDIGAKLADALAVAHAANVVHRDLKPENVILQTINDREQPKILDFGIAKVVSNDGKEPTLTRLGTVFGTPSYMSPEQAQGIPIDYRTDIYSLGVMFYVMLTGTLPISANSPAAQLMAVNLQPPTPLPDEIKAKTPKALQELIFKMLNKKPEDRPQSMLEVRNALEEIKASANAKPVEIKSKGGGKAGWIAAALMAAAAGGLFVHGNIHFIPNSGEWLAYFENGKFQTAKVNRPLVSSVTAMREAYCDECQRLTNLVATNGISDGSSDSLSDAVSDDLPDTLVNASSEETPEWTKKKETEVKSPVETHFYQALNDIEEKGVAVIAVQADLATMTLRSFTSQLAQAGYKNKKMEEALAAHDNYLSAIRAAKGDERQELSLVMHAKEQAVVDLAEANVPQLLATVETYWERWVTANNDSSRYYYKIWGHSVINPQKLNFKTILPVKEFKKTGLKVGPIPPVMGWIDDHTKGVYVTDVKSKGVAAKAGLMAGDIVISINGKAIANAKAANEILAKLESKPPKKKVALEVSRNNEVVTLYLFDKTPAKGVSGKKPLKK